MITVKKDRVPTYIISLLPLISISEVVPILGHSFFYPIAIMLIKNTNIVKLWFTASYIISRFFMLSLLIPVTFSVPVGNIYSWSLIIGLFLLVIIEYHYEAKLWSYLLEKYKTNISRKDFLKSGIKYSAKVALIGGVVFELIAFVVLLSITELILYWGYNTYLFIFLVLIVLYPFEYIFCFIVSFIDICIYIIVLPYINRIISGIVQFQKNQAFMFNGVE